MKKNSPEIQTTVYDIVMQASSDSIDFKLLKPPLPIVGQHVGFKVEHSNI